MVRERGSSKTPAQVTDLLKEEIKKTGIVKLENATGVGKAALSRYSKGIGEPTTATLEKLSAYFGVSVAWLQGHYPQMSYVEAKQFDASMKAQRAANLEGSGAPDVPVYAGWCARCGGPVVLRKKSLAILGYDVDPCPNCCKQASSSE